MPNISASDEPIHTPDDLVRVFHESARAEHLLGPEMEKCGVHAADFAPVTYEGVVTNVLADLVAHHGWHAERESDNGPLIALVRDGASVTLEPGGQLELSGAPAADVHAIDAELRRHLSELKEISARLGVRWLGIGFHPFARREDLRWVPKGRYVTMREYFPKRGAHGIDMMLRTCTVQVNLDYASEADAMRKMRLSLAIAPLTTAMFANSPYVEGAAFGGVTMRGKVWLDVDASRTGLVPALWKRDARFEDYVKWALAAPMFVIKRGDTFISNTEQTFADFLAHGKDGHHATQTDWQTHLNTLFPEVRLKKTIEIRGADAQAPSLASALPALYAGLLYDDAAVAGLEALVEDWTFDEVNALRNRAWETGLRTPFRGRPLADVVSQVIDLARGGLERRAKVDASGRDERVYLGPLEALASRGTTPAEELMARVGDVSSADFKKRVIAETDLSTLR